MSAIKAKGFDAPVQTYMPIWTSKQIGTLSKIEDESSDEEEDEEEFSIVEVSTKLFGRHDIISEIMKFLSSAVNYGKNEGTSCTSDAVAAGFEEPSPRLPLATTVKSYKRTQMLLLCGPYGIGKTAVMGSIFAYLTCGDSIADRFALIHQEHVLDYKSSVPFFTWKALFTRMLSSEKLAASLPHLFEDATLRSPLAGGAKRGAPAGVRRKSRLHPHCRLVLKELVKTLPEELKVFEPLLVGFVNDYSAEGTERTKSLTEEQRSECTIKILAALMQRIIEGMGRPILLTL
jgi:hypothetical protein